MKTARTWMKNVIAICAVLLFTAAVTGCNTVEGIGEDVKAGGEALDKAAEDAN